MNRLIIFMIMLPIHIHIDCSESIPATTLHHVLVDKSNQPTPTLLRFCEKMRCIHQNTLPSITTSTQQLLRPAGKERWENETNVSPNAEHLQIFEELCLVQEIVPTQKSYDYALFLGGVFNDVRIRVAHMIDLWKNKGIRFKSIVILGSKRP